MIVLDILTWVLVSLGGVFCVIGATGMLRMPDFFTRMHAASVIDTLGAGLIIGGLMLQSGFTLASVKLLILGALIFFTSRPSVMGEHVSSPAVRALAISGSVAVLTLNAVLLVQTLGLG